MSLLITGGAGFCGLNIAEWALARGETVVCYGIEPPSAAAQRQFSSLPGRYIVQSGDVCDAGALRAAMQANDVRHVVHAAAITAGMAREASETARIVRVNLGGTIEVMEACLAQKVSRVVQLSSGSIFGAGVRTTVVPLDEDRDPPVPDSVYGISKYAAERLCVRYRTTRGLDVAIVRLGVVFGRWEHDTGVRDTLSIPWQLTACAAAGGHAVLNPVLPQDWVYATDVASAVGQILYATHAPPRAVYHLSAGRCWSAEDWCARLAAHYPGFTYVRASDSSQINVGVQAPTPRPRFSVERLSEDYGFRARFGPEAAFEDYMAWRAAAQ
jgi:nucleoside-diphosphate-sugar epimerase